MPVSREASAAHVRGPRTEEAGLTWETENWTGCPTKERSPEWSGCELPLWGCLVLSPRREESSIASRICTALTGVCFSSVVESELILLKDKKELVELVSSKSSTVSTELR